MQWHIGLCLNGLSLELFRSASALTVSWQKQWAQWDRPYVARMIHLALFNRSASKLVDDAAIKFKLLYAPAIGRREKR